MTELYQKKRFFIELFSNSHPIIKLFLVFFVVLTSLLIFSFISILLAIPFFHISLNNLEIMFKGNLSDIPIPLLKYIQITQSLAIFVFPSILLSYIIFTDKNESLLNKAMPSLLIIFLVIAVLLFSIPIIDKLLQ